MRPTSSAANRQARDGAPERFALVRQQRRENRRPAQRQHEMDRNGGEEQQGGAARSRQQKLSGGPSPFGDVVAASDRPNRRWEAT